MREKETISINGQVLAAKLCACGVKVWPVTAKHTCVGSITEAGGLWVCENKKCGATFRERWATGGVPRLCHSCRHKKSANRARGSMARKWKKPAPGRALCQFDQVIPRNRSRGKAALKVAPVVGVAVATAALN